MQETCWNNRADFQLVEPGGVVAFETDGQWNELYVDVVYKYNDKVMGMRFDDGTELYADDPYTEFLWLYHNPFRSAAQERFMWAKHPRIAERWESEYGSYEHPKGHRKRSPRRSVHLHKNNQGHKARGVKRMDGKRSV